jgi:hypothetical protein
MKVHFHTNLDEAQPFVHRLNKHLTGQNFAPNKGDRIKFYKYEQPTPSDGPQKTFELEVVNRVVSYGSYLTISIELHMPSYYSGMTIREWGEWFNRHFKE